MTQIFNFSVTTRLSFVKNITALVLLTTLLATWPLWTANRYYPVFPGTDLLASVNLIITFAVPILLAICLIMIFILRKPRFFMGLASFLCLSLLAMDTGRSFYWFYFYLVILLLLSGYNWRVDNANHFTTFLLILKIMVAGVYLVTAVQHLRYDFFHSTWPAFVKPFERFWTPEQCAYLAKTAYAVPMIELFIAAGLFFNGTKVAAICFSLLFHIFSFTVLLLQNSSAEAAVLCWHIAMMLIIVALFAGTPGGQKAQAVSLSFYPLFVMLVFGVVVPVYFIVTDKPLKNKLDLMQSNANEQFLYLSPENKQKLPLYVQSFADKMEEDHYKLSVTKWVMHETKTRQVLGTVRLVQLNNSLRDTYGVDALVTLPVKDQLKSIAAK